MTGTLFGSVSTNPWLYFAMANLLLIAALAMLDVLPVRVPTTILRARERRPEQRDGRPARLPWGRCRGWWRRPVRRR